MLLNPDQIAELLKIVEKYTLVFISHKIGTNVLSEEQIDTLKSYGVDTLKIQTQSTVQQAFAFGILSTVLNEPSLHNLSFESLKEKVANNKLLSPLNTLEKNALESLQLQTYNDVNKLSNTIKSDIVETLVFVDKQNNTVQHSKIVTDAVKEAIEQRKSVTRVVSIIGEKTEQWNKDLGRISDYVMHTAFEEGRAAGYERKDGNNVLVYKDVYPGACSKCVKAYLKAGIGSQPVVFKLSELKANGNNIKKPITDWKPTLCSLHPWCRCSLKNCPPQLTLEGLESGLWYWDGKNFVVDKTKWERKVQRTSKIGVTINGVETLI